MRRRSSARSSTNNSTNTTSPEMRQTCNENSGISGWKTLICVDSKLGDFHSLHSKAVAERPLHVLQSNDPSSWASRGFAGSLASHRRNVSERLILHKSQIGIRCLPRMIIGHDSVSRRSDRRFHRKHRDSRHDARVNIYRVNRKIFLDTMRTMRNSTHCDSISR